MVVWVRHIMSHLLQPENGYESAGHIQFSLRSWSTNFHNTGQNGKQSDFQSHLKLVENKFFGIQSSSFAFVSFPAPIGQQHASLLSQPRHRLFFCSSTHCFHEEHPNIVLMVFLFYILKNIHFGSNISALTIWL